MCGPDADPPVVPYKSAAWLELAQAAASGGGDGQLVIESVPLEYEGYTYAHSRIVYVRGQAPAPVVLIHPNYAGLKEFDVDQACFLARAGYVGFALDLYKDEAEYRYADRNPAFKGMGSTVDEATEATKHYAGAFAAMNELLRTPVYWRGLMAAYQAVADAHPAVATGLAGAIGYCFGGQCLLEQVRAGHPLQAVVSFHGLLESRPTHLDDPLGRRKGRLTKEQCAAEFAPAPNAYSIGCKVLIENGDLDDHVPLSSIADFRTEMDGQGIDWRINNHSQTPHGFALAPGVWSAKCAASVLFFCARVDVCRARVHVCCAPSVGSSRCDFGVCAFHV